MTKGGGIYPGCLCIIIGADRFNGRVCTATEKAEGMVNWGAHVEPARIDEWRITIPGAPPPPGGKTWTALEKVLRPLQPPPETRIVDIVEPLVLRNRGFEVKVWNREVLR